MKASPRELAKGTTWLPLGELEVDHEFQRRRYRHAHAKKLGESWDWDRVGALTVSSRPSGANIVLDGQHRVSGARLRGFPAETLMPCIEIFNLTTKAEAAMAVAMNTNRLGWVPLHAFMGRLEAGDPVTLGISATLNRHGWEVRESHAEGVFRAIAAAYKVYSVSNGSGPRVFDRTIAAITRAWGHQEHAVGAALVEGVAGVFAMYPHVEDSGIVAVLEKTQPGRLRSDAVRMSQVSRASIARSIRELVVGNYDARRRSGRLRDREE